MDFSSPSDLHSSPKRSVYFQLGLKMRNVLAECGGGTAPLWKSAMACCSCSHSASVATPTFQAPHKHTHTGTPLLFSLNSSDHVRFFWSILTNLWQETSHICLLFIKDRIQICTLYMMHVCLLWWLEMIYLNKQASTYYIGNITAGKMTYIINLCKLIATKRISELFRQYFSAKLQNLFEQNRIQFSFYSFVWHLVTEKDCRVNIVSVKTKTKRYI